MEKVYTTSGVCSRQIKISVDKNGIIENVMFVGGCNGNTQGISALAKGRSIDEVIATLKGIKCGFKKSSCPDQLARALEEIRDEL